MMIFLLPPDWILIHAVLISFCNSFFLLNLPHSPVPWIPILISPFSFSTLSSFILSPCSTSAPGHHVNYTTALVLLASPRFSLALSPSLLWLLCCQYFARVCSHRWREEGVCTGAEFNNKWLFSMVWLTQIRGLAGALRRWQRSRWHHRCSLSTSESDFRFAVFTIFGTAFFEG